ncbi:MAG: hypothetical protein Q4F05_17010 [bacterium]|nr:hypothetical protein [bacterium]
MSTEKQFIRSERAHFMCPNMHFGILAKIRAKTDMQKIKDSLDRMAKAHPFLRSRIKYESDHKNLYYEIQDDSTIELFEKTDCSSIWEDYRKISETEWDVFAHGLLKVIVYPIGQEMSLLFVSHHLLGDGRCLLELVDEFTKLYVQNVEPDFVEERLITSIEELPENSNLTGISRYLVRSMNKKWRKEKTAVTYKEYTEFSNQFVKNNPVDHIIKSVEPQKLRRMKTECKKNQITLNDLLMAKAYIGLSTKKIIIAADVRDKISCYNKGACGNYATAMGIVLKGKQKDVIKTAKEVHNQVKNHMESNRKLMLILACYLNMDAGLIDAAAIATLGEFESKAARFVGASMFGYLKRDGISITNLGHIQNPHIIEATFIPPASPATIQTIGVLTVNDHMQLCSSYYEHAVSKKVVRRQLDFMS